MSTPAADATAVMELQSWEARSMVTAAMLNPALIALIVTVAANRYEHDSGEPMPWELSFLVVPMALHADSRNAVPTRVTSRLPKWVNDNPLIAAGLGPRAEGVAPYVREGIRWGLRAGALTLDSEGRFIGTVHGRFNKGDTPDLREVINTARFLGRWFASVGSMATVFALLGVTP
ncbi:three component ABC system middle component [Curtobacterium sp. NPDC089991]|uniref:three component ABC system middle component n=1 Tax=Curtobacterium sp. NPDC089991 TaxID=3363969 RepID=UPI00382219DD